MYRKTVAQYEYMAEIKLQSTRMARMIIIIKIIVIIMKHEPNGIFTKPVAQHTYHLVDVCVFYNRSNAHLPQYASHRYMQDIPDNTMVTLINNQRSVYFTTLMHINAYIHYKYTPQLFCAQNVREAYVWNTILNGPDYIHNTVFSFFSQKYQTGDRYFASFFPILFELRMQMLRVTTTM